MLSHEDNQALVRVGPGTAMGRLMRLYWIPFLLSKDVSADGQPYRVRLLGEDLVIHSPWLSSKFGYRPRLKNNSDARRHNGI